MLSDKNSNIYKKLYSEEKIDEILSDSSFIKKILLFEKMLLKANYQLKNISYEAYKNINKAIDSTDYETHEIQENLEYSGVITLNILNRIKKKVKQNYIPYLHNGATSQDAIDTAIILQIKDSKSLLINSLKNISLKLFKLAEKNTNTLTVARTRNKIATVTTFAFKVSNWLLPIVRNLERLKKVYDDNLYIQLGGPTGNLVSFNNKGIKVKKRMSYLLGLSFDEFSWHNQRDRIIELCNNLALITGSIGKIAIDLLILSQDEISEISFNKRGISSSIPHKNNPIIAELLVSLAKLNSNQLSVIHESLVHRNERDGIAWTIEWNALYNMLRYTSASLSHFNKCISLIKLNKGNMKKNIDNTYGLVMSAFLYKELLKIYPAFKLEKIFPNLIDKALKEKTHLIDVINNHLGRNLNISKDTSLLTCAGVNGNLIKILEKKISKIL